MPPHLFDDESIENNINHFITTFKSLNAIEYANIVNSIYEMVKKQDISAVKKILFYLRPWDIIAEDNWIGREIIRGIAMQSLCYLAKKDDSIKEYIMNIPNSLDEDMNQYDDHLRQVWGEYTDVSCLPVPEEDFLRCVEIVKKWIRSENENPEK